MPTAGKMAIKRKNSELACKSVFYKIDIEPLGVLGHYESS